MISGSRVRAEGARVDRNGLYPEEQILGKEMKGTDKDERYRGDDNTC